MTAERKKLLLAIGAALLAALSNALMAACIKWEIGRGVSISAVIFFRYFLGLLFLIPLIHFSSPSVSFLQKIRTKRPALHLVRSFTGFIAIFLFCYVLQDLSLTIATLLFFTIPLFMPFVAFVWKRKALPRLGWIGIIIGFLGILLVLQPSEESFNPAIILGLLAGFLTTIGQFSSHLLTTTDSSQKINFYYFLILSVLGGLLTLYAPAKNWENLTPDNLLVLLFLGLFGVSYLLFLTYALKHAHPSLITSFLYATILFSLLLDWLVWHHAVNGLALLGVFCVILGVVLKLIFYHIDLARLKKH